MVALADQAWSIAVKAFYSVWHVFDELLRASGMMPVYLTMVLFVLAFRLLAAPLVGDMLNSGSDTYRSKRTKNQAPDSGTNSRKNKR